MIYENEQIEFKRELNDKFELDVVAFLNSKGGHIYLEFSDDGTTYGIDDIDEIQLEIKDRLKDKISPSPIGFFEILVEERDNKQIIHVIIASGNEKPYYLKKFGMTPKASYTRVGSASVQLNEKQYLIFTQNEQELL
ncbi:MAG: ATP-binding protein [Clostridiales bacterium]|jgi:predicted HTH transcriptional regulator|nr:ATP-binding protein [Clostridiales bacterium]